MALRTSYQSMTGADLKAERKAAGLSQAKLASLAGIHRLSVCYWEKKSVVGRRYDWAANRMLEVLGIKVLYVYAPSTRARGDGVLVDSQQEWLDRQYARLKEKALEQAARYRQPCSAKTRKGHPCRLMSERGKRRCKFHGGMSTGPRTAAGKAKIAAVQRKRWADRRVCQLQVTSTVKSPTFSASSTGEIGAAPTSSTG